MNNIEKITLFKKPEESPGYLLWHISLTWRTLIEETLKTFNLTHPQFVILTTTAWLTKDHQHINQIDISKHSGLDPNTTSQILRTLESKKLITRNRSINERNKNPRLTDAGQHTLNRALPAVEKADASFFALLSDQEITFTMSIFQKYLKYKNS